MKHEHRYRQLIRCLRLLRLVEGQRRVVDLEMLANQLRVSTRTIKRDLAALAMAGEDVPSVAKAYAREMAA